MSNAFFENPLASTDQDLYAAIQREFARQQDHIELIASENIVSQAVLDAQGSILTNKYAEGYPGRRYYGGCAYVDEVENLAIDRAKKLFGARFANVQPHSGSQANQAVFLALMQPGDTYMGLDLGAGGHLTHGAKVNMSGKWFNAVHYHVKEKDGLIDYEDVLNLAKQHKPKLIIAGGSSYSRIVDFAKFRAIADEVGAHLMVDMAHFAGLVAGGVYPSPVPHAHVVTTTTHKTLRGPRGGMILTNDEDLAKKINSAIFPGLQGGPLMHVIAAKAVAFGEALKPEFKNYARQIVDNARTLCQVLVEGGLEILSGGTDSHLLVVDLRPMGLTGKAAEEALDRVNITCNKNAIPYDTEKPMVTSGIRLGTPACTTRGFDQKAFEKTGALILEMFAVLKKNPDGEERAEKSIRAEVIRLCQDFPIYPG